MHTSKNKAHIILGAVIGSHGGQLMTSNAFCKVYLTGYMADYPEEKKILIGLKLMELPKKLSAYVNGDMSDADLIESIRKVAESSAESENDIAWGVDAWAAAAGITEEIRCIIRRQCFPEVSKEIDLGHSLLHRQSVLIEETPPELTVSPVSAAESAPVHRSRHDFGDKLVIFVVGVSGLIALQVFGGNLSAPEEIPMVLSQQATTVAPAEMLSEKVVATVLPAEKPSTHIPENKTDTSLLDLSVPAQPLKVNGYTAHDIVQIDKLSATTQAKNLKSKRAQSQQKSQQLHAEIEAFLKYGN